MSDFKVGPFFGGIGKNPAAFGAKNGVITVVSELDVRGALRNPDGTFTAFQGNVAKANAALSIELAESVAKAQQASTVRPGVASGRLQAVLLSPKNRVADRFGYGVGKPEFMDQSVAKYWRQIDQGFSGHVGREIRGVFGSTLVGGSPTERGVAGPVFTGIGAEGESGGRLRPFGYSKLRPRGSERSTRGTIGKPISPQRFFKRGWEAFDARGRTTSVVKAELAAAFGGKGVPTRALIASQRQGPKGPRPPAAGKRFAP